MKLNLKSTITAITIGSLITATSANAQTIPTIQNNNTQSKQTEKSYSIGLSMYSLRQLFKDGSLTALDYPAFAKKTFGITQIDVWDGGFPKGKQNDIAYYKELKKRSDQAGTNIFLVMTGAVEARGKTTEERKKAGMQYASAVDYAEILGSDFVRVFLNAPKGDRDTAINQSIDALTPLADYAKNKNITIVIEPGSSPWARKGPFLADLAKKINHPALKLMPDFGKMRYDDPYGGTIAMMPHSVSVSAKSYDFDEQGNEKHLDYSRLLKSVNDAKYTGIIAIEYEGHKLGPVEGVKATQKLLQRYQKKSKQ